MLLALNGVSAHAADFADPAFEQRDIVEGLDFPTDVAWAPDGRMFIAEQAGVLKVLNLGSTEAVPILDISSIVGNQHDRGLLGIAVDSAYASNNYVYLLYTRDTGLVADDPGPMVSQLRRYTISPANVVSSFTEILGTYVPSSGGCPAPSNTLDCVPSDSPSHSIGTVISASDGTLWVGSGDAAEFGGMDLLALRSYEERSLAGKILHIDRNGNGLPGHPFCPADSNLTHVCTKLHAKGFRNPFRFKLRPGGAGLAVGDVGWNSREEVDLVPLSPAGRSYGWPCYEGTLQTPGYSELPECEAEYAKPPGTHTPPAYEYPHDGSNAVVAGPVYTANNYPAAYRDRLYIGDYATGVVQRLTIGAGDQVTAAEPFMSGWIGVDLEQTPDGNIAWADPFAGAVYEAVYAPGNRSPTAATNAIPSSGTAPLDVQFFGDYSSDPDGDPLTYDWDFGDGTPHGTATNPSHTYALPGTYTARLTVSDGRGGSDSDTVQVSAGNSAPNTPTISTPVDESLYRDGATVNLQGSATDPQEGTLPGAALSWTVTLHHGGHTHPLLNDLPGAQQSFQALTDHDADSYYDVTLTARDAGGLTSSRTVQIRPETASFSIQSSPPGAPISYAGTGQTAPFSTQAAVGFQTSVSAAQQFTQAGHTWEFDRWSDGGARAHNVTVPATATTLTASYRDITPGSITVVKQTDPVGSSEQFGFTGALGSFSLTGAGGGNSRTFEVAPGTYAVTEAAKAGWDLALLACSDGSAVSGRTATIQVSPDEDVTCTFRNARRGSVTIVKQTDPAGAPDQFDFTGALGGFSLTGAAGGNSRSFDVAAGSYAVTESAKPGWDLTLLTCDDGSAISGRTANIAVSPGENVSCTYRNTKEGSITVAKQTEPDGSTEQFDFAGDAPLGNFALADGQTRTVSVDPGTYSVTELEKGGWDLTELSCGDGSSTSGRTASVGISPGESVTCTFRNTKEASITIEKQTEPQGATTQFDFAGSGPLGNFGLADDQARTVSVDPGSYTVSELATPGWDLSEVDCSDSGLTAGPGVTIDVAPDESVRCVFTNVQRGWVKVRALTDPPEGAAGGVFAFTADPPLESFQLTDGQAYERQLPPGTYALRQEPAAGYSLASVGCDDADSTGSASARSATVRLAAGEAVTCSFTARRLTAIVEPEEDDPALGAPAPDASADDPGAVGNSDPEASLAGLGRRRRVLAGTLRDPDGVTRVAVALGRRLGRPDRCRWWSTKVGRLAARARPCARPRWLETRLSGEGELRGWRVRLRGSLPRGSYRILLLVVDALGNRERLALRI